MPLLQRNFRIHTISQRYQQRKITSTFQASFILTFRPTTTAGLTFIQLTSLLPVKPRTRSRNHQKNQMVYKLIQMAQTGSLLKQSTEYNTSGLDNQKPTTRQYIPGECTGKWSDEEHMKYIAFLDANKEIMKSKEKRRSNKFYREMADFVQTRNPLQCRSHHQKLEVKYIHPIKIVSYFRQQFDTQTYKQIKQGLTTNKKTKYIPKQIKTTAHQNLEGKVKIETADEQPYFPFSQSLPFIQMPSYPSGSSLYMSVPYSWVQPVFAYGFEFN